MFSFRMRTIIIPQKVDSFYKVDDDALVQDLDSFSRLFSKEIKDDDIQLPWLERPSEKLPLGGSKVNIYIIVLNFVKFFISKFFQKLFFRNFYFFKLLRTLDKNTWNLILLIFGLYHITNKA